MSNPAPTVDTGQNNARPMGEHVRATIVLGVPLVAAQIAQMLITVIDTVMLGWLGVAELAAGTLAGQLFFLFIIFGLGFAAAMIPLVAGALGKGDEREVRRSARMGLWALVALSIAFMVPLWFTRDILLVLGQEVELVDLAERYMRIAQWSLIPAFVLIGLRGFLTALEWAGAVLAITIFATVLNAALNYAFIFGNWGAPRLEMEGAAVATVLANLAAAVLAAIVVAVSKKTRGYSVFTRFWRPDWAALSTISRLGFPISLTILAEAGLFSAASIMIGWLGKEPLAAHGIALQIASLAFMVPLGLSQVASVRVGNAVGRSAWMDVALATRAVIWLAVGFAVISGVVFIAIPEVLSALFLDADDPNAPTVLQLTVPLLYMAAAFQIVDGLQAVGSGALRGLKDTKVPMIMATIAYWPVGLSAAYFFAYPMGYGATGVWAGLVAGLAVASVCMIGRFILRTRYGLTPA
ncbi:MATE family efflux transporter [Pseudahrensia aquimaris]|uniref:Multidrug-efflux transporter n=1 Tax=Pseudahrensia aquimaris TaxID=744461 RepID=A0ABW3FIU0_9HYPH